MHFHCCDWKLEVDGDDIEVDDYVIDDDIKDAPEATAPSELPAMMRSMVAPAAVKEKAGTSFEVNINAAFKQPVKYKAGNGREQTLVQIPQCSVEVAF